MVAGADVTVPASAAAAPTVAGTAPSATASPVTPGAYRVQPGDSLSTVAARNGLSAAALAAASGLSSIDLSSSGAHDPPPSTPGAASPRHHGVAADHERSPIVTPLVTTQLTPEPAIEPI